MYSVPSLPFNTGMKMFNDTSSCFGINNKRELFISVRSGSWSDITMWETVSGRVGLTPTNSDDIFVREGHILTLDSGMSGQTASVFNCYLAGTLTATGGFSRTLQVVGNIKVTGTLAATAQFTLQLFGSDNNIPFYTYNNLGQIQYVRSDGFPQPILPLNTGTISISGSGLKFLTGDMTLASLNVSAGGMLDCLHYNLTTTSVAAIQNVATFYKSGSGILSFGGLLTVGNQSTIYLAGNPTIELKAGAIISNSGISIYFGTGLINITTASQSISTGLALSIVNNIAISDNIILTIAGAGSLTTDGTIDGLGANAKLTNQSTIEYRAALMPMVTGLIDFLTTANTFRYSMAGNQDVKGGNYKTVVFATSGVKTLQGNVVTNPLGSYSNTGTATTNLNGFTLT